MTPFVQDSDFTLHVGDALEVLATLPDESVHCVVTSPPYWGLRDYGTGAWEGGDPDCDHVAPRQGGSAQAQEQKERGERKGYVPSSNFANYGDRWTAQAYTDVCGKCGATRTDQQLGLEASPDEFVARMVDVFREVRRVLRSDGTCWVNLGDSYANPPASGTAGQWAPGGSNKATSEAVKGQKLIGGTLKASGLKQKDLCGIPWRVAFALQADGWYLRSDIIWSKPNPMPESVTDRPTKAHEYVFLLTKSARYFYDADAIREPQRSTDNRDHPGSRAGVSRPEYEPHRPDGPLTRERIPMRNREWNPAGRNVRSVWEIATQPYPEAHFATFPEALPERCIRAGTSERGCCLECGAPWERETEVTKHSSPRYTASYEKAHGPDGRDFDRPTLTVETTGWKPSCGCAEGTGLAGGGVVTEGAGSRRSVGPSLEPISCTVLDPFMGSGTTALVARRLGRRSIGIELNQSYAELCARRLQQLSLLAEA